MVSRCGVEVGGEVFEGLACDGAFEAAQDVFLGQALVESALHVRLGAGIVAQAAHGDLVEGLVGLAVSASVQARATSPARGDRDGSGSAQAGEGGLAVEALDVGPGGDQEAGGGVSADAGPAGQGGGRGCHQGVEPGVQGADLLVQGTDARGDASQGGPDGLGGPVRGAGAGRRRPWPRWWWR